MITKALKHSGLLSFVFLFFHYTCSETPPAPISTSQARPEDSLAAYIPPPSTCADTFSRDSILLQLRSKIKRSEALVVHVFVPLCDNVHQGIVRVNKQLGDGLNLRTNLYWGAGYGVSSFFKNSKTWRLLHAERDLSPDILERLVFEKKYANGASVLLVADAYRGDRMEACIRAFLKSLAGQTNKPLALPETTVSLGAPDLAIFNGHNGLMDMDLEQISQTKHRQKDAAVIACAAHSYFIKPLRCAGAFPLLTTVELLAPEAYVMSALIDSWARLKPATQVRVAAAQAYAKYQKCGYKGASRIFHTGWE